MAVSESPHIEPVSTAHGYCIALYDALSAKADGDTFTGKVTEVYQTLGISNQYYSRIIRALVEVGSIEHVQRGHHKRPTIYRLIDRPTREQLEQYDFLTPGTKRKRVTDKELLQRLEKLERSTQGIDVIAAFTNLEARIKALEKKQSGGT